MKKQSGLKQIASQLIEIMKKRPPMSYPQVAHIIVSLNLRNSLIKGDLLHQSYLKQCFKKQHLDLIDGRN